MWYSDTAETEMASRSSQTAGGVGRQRSICALEDILFLWSLSFTWTDIAEQLNVSRQTVYNRLKENGVAPGDECRKPYSRMSDGDLDKFAEARMVDNPRIGEVMLLGHLRAAGHTIQRKRVRESLHRADPSSGERLATTIFTACQVQTFFSILTDITNLFDKHLISIIHTY